MEDCQYLRLDEADNTSYDNTSYDNTLYNNTLYENNHLKRLLAKAQSDLKSAHLYIRELESELERKEDGENSA